jgi:CIC family chloride channel protein
VQFALAGMAAMVGGTTGAVLTATVMVFEMTRDYTVILPVIVTVTIACAVRQRLLPQTIYTLKLVRRGHVVPQGLQAWMGEELPGPAAGTGGRPRANVEQRKG